MAQETSAEKIARLERKIEGLEKEIARLQRLLEEALRAVKRQAAPFSRQNPKAAPEKPGRKPGKKYGRPYRRAVPEQVDEVIEVPLPSRCPRCRGELEECETVSQFQTEIPTPRVERIEFRIHVGRCRHCRRRVQGRHPRQTSDAVGSAASQLGPRALALATQLNKGLGLPYGKTATVLEQAFGLQGRKTLVANKIVLKSKELTSIALTCLALRNFHEVSRAVGPQKTGESRRFVPGPGSGSPSSGTDL